MKPPNTTAVLLVLVAVTMVYLSDSGKLASIVGIVKGPALPAPPSGQGSLLGLLIGSNPLVSLYNGLTGTGSTPTTTTTTTGNAGMTGPIGGTGG